MPYRTFNRWSTVIIADVNSTSGLMKMARLREAVLFKKLGAKMATAAAGKAGVFDTWMLEESDLIQAAARAYGDRLIADRLALDILNNTPEIVYKVAIYPSGNLPYIRNYPINTTILNLMYPVVSWIYLPYS